MIGGLIALNEGSERMLTPLPVFHMNAMAYSAMAMVSQTETSSWVRRGTRIDGDSNRISARASTSPGGTSCSSNGKPENLVSSHPRNDQDE